LIAPKFVLQLSAAKLLTTVHKQALRWRSDRQRLWCFFALSDDFFWSEKSRVHEVYRLCISF